MLLHEALFTVSCPDAEMAGKTFYLFNSYIEG